MSLGPFSTYHDQNQSNDRYRLHTQDYRSVLQLQIGNSNNFGYDRIRMDQDLPYAFRGNISDEPGLRLYLAIDPSLNPQIMQAAPTFRQLKIRQILNKKFATDF